MGKEKGKVAHPKISADPSDVSTIDEIIKAFYESLSYAVGKQPDYRRWRSLFHERGIVTPSKTSKDSNTTIMDVDIFIKESVENIVITGMERKGLVQTEVARRTQAFGNIVQIFSTFEAHRSSRDLEQLPRGVYSIQLLRENHRWWIVSILEEIERPNLALPKAYLV